MDDSDASDPMQQFFPGEENVDLYGVLELTTKPTDSITVEQVKKAYRRLALLHHPDKHTASSESQRAASSLKFQQVGFAYTVLSDAERRARYDKTGRTDEDMLKGLADAEGGWEKYFEAVYEKVDRARLDEDKRLYEGSEDERADVIASYNVSSGSLTHILSSIPHSTYHSEPRLITIVNSLISSGSLISTKLWEKESKDNKAHKNRMKEGKKEEKEAEKAARELGVWDEFYGSGKPSQKKRGAGTKPAASADDGKEAEDDESALQALILKRAESRKAKANSFLDGLAAKYGGGEDDVEPSSSPKTKPKGKGKKKRASPSDHEEEDDVTASPRKKSRTTRQKGIDDKESAAVHAGRKKSNGAATTSNTRSAGRGKRS